MSENAISNGEIFSPPPNILENANVKEYEQLYQRSLDDPEGFWGERAEELEWYKKWDKVLDDSNAPFFKWFTGGKVNIVHNALDRHLKTYRKNKLALIWEGENGETKSYSYYALNREVVKFSNVLRSMGVKKGDIVTIYMPRIPEQVIAMLACAKVGAAHSVVYGGFSVEALAERIQDAQSKLLITADGGWMRGKIVELKGIVDEAIARQATIENVIVVRRTEQDIYMETGRDYWYHDLIDLPIATQQKGYTEEMDAEDPLFILYTSGTTGRPKGILHTHGGYMVYTYTTLKYVFDIKDEDRWWCAADPGWDHRAQLYHLRPPAEWGYQLHVRGRTQLSVPQPMVEDDRKLRHHDHVHSPNRHPRPDALWRCLGTTPRPQQPAPVGQCG